jgi:arylsulfatase A-like enzyme
MIHPHSIPRACALALAGLTLFSIPAISPAAGASTTPIAPATAAAQRPNIIFLISDDQRWDCLGIAGNPAVKTPNLDRMAREGQWYPHAVIQMPLCAPSRAAMITGMPPSVSGYYSNSVQRKDVQRPDGFLQYKTLPRQMSDAGYHTAFTGKWHLRPDPWLCGFETIKHWMLPGMGPYKDPRLANGNSRQVQRVDGFTQTIFANDAIDILKAKADNPTTRPLFLWVAFTSCHTPFVPNPPPFSGMYDAKTARDLAPPSSYYDDPAQVKGGDKTWQQYYEAISALDGEVGRIINTVRNTSLSTNTLVVFLGDNGFAMGSRGDWGKGSPYDESLRVPLIVWAPEPIMHARGTTVTASVNSLDLPATFLTMAGATPPAKWAGRDISAVIRDGQPHDITWSVSQNPDPKVGGYGSYRVIRTPTHKLILWNPSRNKSPELYDLVTDPAEKTNLYGKPEAAAIQARLQEQLEDFRAASGDTEWEWSPENTALNSFSDERE